MGNGMRVKFWKDELCGDGHLCLSVSSLYALTRDIKRRGMTIYFKRRETNPHEERAVQHVYLLFIAAPCP